MAAHIRTLKSDEVELFRELRLRAIDDTPQAFVESRKEALARSAAEWRELAELVAGQPGSVMFVAEEKQRASGFIFGRIDPEERLLGHIGGLWVDRACARRDTADALLESTIHWARSCGLQRLLLMVAGGASVPERVYLNAGFRNTGCTEKMPGATTVEMREMLLEL